MRVFLSWSGARSQAVAAAFRAWLPDVIQEIEPWISSEDIAKGASWIKAIRDAILESNGVGVFFLTPEALSSGWVHFEAGGIAAVENERVCTVCVGIKPHDLRPPLNFFQATTLERDDVFRLVQSLNARALRPIEEGVLTRSFDRSWGSLEKGIREAEDRADVGQQAPTSAASSRQAATEDLGTVLDALRRIERRLGAIEQQVAGQPPPRVRLQIDPQTHYDLDRLVASRGGSLASATAKTLGQLLREKLDGGEQPSDPAAGDNS